MDTFVGMNNWLAAVLLVLQAHFAISYIVPIDKSLPGWFTQFISWVFPWGLGDSGVLGSIGPGVFSVVGFFIAMVAGALSLLAVLAVFGIVVPHDWWRALAVAGSVLSLVVLFGFFGPTKVIPIAFDLGVMAAVLTNWAPIAERAAR